MPQKSAVNKERIVRPAAAPGPLDNPLKGWCTYTDAGEINQPYSMIYEYISWKDLEPKAEDYRFAEWEQTWEQAAARGKQVIFRIYVDYPSKASGLPDWLKAAGVKTTPYTDYGGGVSPDYNDPKFITAAERLLEAVGKRYDTHPRIAFVQMGFLGFWGEWHTYPRNELFASAATQQKMLEASQRAFPNKIVMTRYPGGFAGTQSWLGFFDDMFPEDTDGPEEWKFLPVMRRSGRMANWKRAAIGGEMVPGKASQWLGKDFDQTRKRLDDAHFSWVGPYSPALQRNPSPEFIARSQQLVRRMGYSFRLTEIGYSEQVGPQGLIDLRIVGENTGVAPFYYRWPVEIGLLDANRRAVAVAPIPVDVRTWLPGRFKASASVPVQIQPGQYTLALRIRNPWKEGPALRFANALPAYEDWTLLGKITRK